MSKACQLLEKEKFLIGMNEPSTPESKLDYYKKLTAMLVHEINNPLTTVKGFLQLIKPDLKKIGKEEYANISIEEIDRVNNLIADFLSVVKPLDDEKIVVYINKMINDLGKLFHSEATMKNIKINIHLTMEDIPLFVIEKKVRQVLINLIKNAIEAIEESNKDIGVIDISTEMNCPYLSIHIEDNGCGMSEETATHLFTPFYTTKPKGTGIGLSICKEIIELHQGQIFYSTKKNQGSTFTVKLPI